MQISFCSINNPENRYDCYVIDSNGFIIYALKDEDIGKFFGTIVGGADAMQKMVDHKIFRKIHMFDYQALQKKNKNVTSSSSSSLPNVSIDILNFFCTVLLIQTSDQPYDFSTQNLSICSLLIPEY